jgi:hypothetical protein
VYTCVRGNPAHELAFQVLVVITIKYAVPRNLERKKRIYEKEKFIKVLLVAVDEQECVK